MMCRAEVTGSLVPTVAKQMQSVEPREKKTKRTGCGVESNSKDLAAASSDSVEDRRCDSLEAKQLPKTTTTTTTAI